jgi:DNA-binding LytR/AlgR family response regulator
MNVLIVEDELLAQAKLESMLKVIDQSIHVIKKTGSVKDTVEWLSTNPPPDAAFVDIQLSDDHSFEIFRTVSVKFPVIFTTAFDKYLLESFEFNSIDYLLKPITEDKLRRSLMKIKTLEQHFIQGNLERLLHPSATQTKRLVVKKGVEFLAIEPDSIAYIFTEHRIVFVRDFAGKQFIADRTVGELESVLHGNTFFRINRKYIANIKAIDKFKPDAGKIRVFLKPPISEEVFVSKESAPEFRKWIGAV